MQEIYYPSRDKNTNIHACIWQPEGEVKGVVQIVHGMAEYAERYTPLAEFLVNNGFMVCAEDHLGHGRSFKSKDKMGYFTAGDGSDVVLSDIRQLTEIAQQKVPGKPVFILGHSMGSYFTRVYLSKYSDVAGAIIVGTGYVSKITTGFAKFMTRFLAVFQKWDHKSEFIDKLAFNGYNDKIENPKTKFDWLSTNGANVQKYIEDPLCGFTFTLSGFLGLFSIISKACSAKTIKAVKKDLPIFVIAGKEDPVGRYSEGVLDYCDKLEKYGMTKASVTLYAGARHEILNDNCRVQVMDDILNFINKNI